MSGYGQFCPVAKAMELLDERWTLLVIRELLAGSSRFNDLRRGVPHMSPALLSKRLQRLEHAGLVRKRVDGSHTSYRLTQSGEELRPVVEALAGWGVRWIGDLGQADLDPHLLLWDMRRTIDVDGWPRRRTVVALRFTDVPPGAAHWWLVCHDGDVDLCDFDPGFEVAARLTTTLRALTLVWRGDRSWAVALGSGTVAIDGGADAVARVPAWIGQAPWAVVPRPSDAEVAALREPALA
ncbi:helix-turn-helix domain-containing protein [Agrococcus sp. ARC_14]|uniref:winged helix-turn-helix transcriptional regulator n=1 Tax=Agrococcus sp. ARC_14 TaxID=2919927 RepID=UPI001F06E17D|nr:helix-turn-helix domain-containing protein [Agrococcus sp. ARC_14]MCH1881956.1 helix-turn-helix transcriptional regulator [Agrococcus sp. ARC_14]